MSVRISSSQKPIRLNLEELRQILVYSVGLRWRGSLVGYQGVANCVSTLMSLFNLLRKFLFVMNGL